MKDENKFGGYIIGAVIVLFLFIAITMSVYVVGDGEAGVLFHKWGANKGFNPNEKLQGLHFKMPFRDTVFKISFRTQTIGFFGDASKGQYGAIQPKDMNGIDYQVDVTIRYRLDPTQASEFIELKGRGKPAMEEMMATAARADSTRGIFGQHAQEDVPKERIEMAAKIIDTLQKRIDQEASGKLKQGFIVIEAVDIRNVEFNPRIEEAIVNKQTQKQIAEQKQYELQKALKEKEIAIVYAEKDKEANILVADGEAQAILLIAKAKAKGIQVVNDAYQDMPQQYVSVKFAEAIKPTDKIYLGFESLGGNTMNFLNLNEATGMVYNQGLTTQPTTQPTTE